MESGEISFNKIYKIILVLISFLLILLMSSCTDEAIKSQGLYKIEIANSEQYEIIVDKYECREGESVLITVESVAKGYEVDEFYYLTDGNKNKNYITNPFIMPDSNITLYAEISDNDLEKFTVNDLSLGHISFKDNTLEIMPKEEIIFVGIKDIYTDDWVYLNSIDNDYLYLFYEYSEYVNPNTSFISYFKDYSDFNCGNEFLSDKSFSSFETKLLIDYENGIINYSQYKNLLKFYHEIESNIYSVNFDNLESRYEIVFNRKSEVTNLSVDGVEYCLFNDSEVAVVIGSLSGYTELIIPEKINGYKVVGIMPKYLENFSKTTSAFSSELASIVLPDSITQILPYTFYDLNNLNTFKANSIRSIGDYAFYNSSLSTIDLGNYLTKIGSYCFAFSSLTEIVLPETIKSVSTNAFKNCYSLANISLYSEQLNMLMSSEIYENADTIKLLGQSNQLPLLSIDNNYFTLFSTEFNEYVFHRLSFSSNYNNCGRFSATCMIGNNGDYIYNFDFELSEELNNIFEFKCWKLNGQVVSNNNSFESKILLGIDFNLSIELTEKELFEINGVTYQKIDNLNELIVVSGTSAEGDVEIINCLQILDELYYVTQISAYAFYANNLITSIFIPKNITVIGESAFHLCVSLEKVEFASNSRLSNIQTNAFAYCSSLNDVNLNNCLEVEVIEDFAFAYCVLLDLYIPNSVQTLGAQWSVNSIKFDSQQAFNTFTFMQINIVFINTSINLSLNSFFSFTFGDPIREVENYYLFIR